MARPSTFLRAFGTLAGPWGVSLLLLGLSLSASQATEPVAAPVRLSIEPDATRLEGGRSSAHLIVTGHFADGSVRDLTHEAQWSSRDPEVARVAPGGLVRPQADGQAEVVARWGALEAQTTIDVVDATRIDPVRFEHELLPALTKAGCNQGACHGTPTGKDGFRLSLRGFDPDLDHMTLTREADNRRVNRMNPPESLILKKGLGVVPHQGGPRWTPSSPTYQVVLDWIEEGLRWEPDASPRPVRLEVTPETRILDDPARDQQLVARLHLDDGSVRDVTRLARYSASDETIARITDSGQVQRRQRGEVTILVNYGPLVATSRLAFLEPVPDLVWSDPPEHNVIDTHVFAKLKLLHIPPSDLADDATFVRRVFLDTIGLPPTPDAVRQFLADERPEKRSRLIDELLERSEFVDFWALKWADRLGCNQRFVGKKGAFSYYRWIRDQIAANVPFDQFVRAIITAKGSNYTNPPASFYRRVRNPEAAVETVSQLFLGTRLQCARCHNHVSERWTQDDYYGMAAFFSQVQFKNGPQFYAQYNKEETVFLRTQARLRQPRTGETMAPKPLGAPAPAIAPGADRREALADWLTAPENPFFARATVNRLWYHLMGRGIVEPVDDLRESNPPASEALLQALADDFIAHGFDTKRTIRLILNSRTYQLSSQPNAWNAHDDRYFSHAKVRLLSAEQLLDAVSQVTGVPERFFHLPEGTRASQIPDGELVHPFLKTFGQPERAEACECERETDSTLEQALQIVGGRTIHDKITAPENRIGLLIQEGIDDATLVEELFLAALGRVPSDEEQDLVLASFPEGNSAEADQRRRAAEDLLWSLINHPEFLFQH